jgi:hypothetical protein
MLNFHAQIEPGRGAAGLSIGDPIGPLPEAERHAARDLGNGLTLLDFGSVRVWARGGAVEQIGLRGQYNGCVAGTAIGVGSTLQQVVDALGPVGEDEEDNLVALEIPGLCFETEAWRGEAGRETVEENLDAQLTEIFVFDAEAS